MKVFNLLDKPLDYRGRILAPGKSQDFPELDKYVPDRDRRLEKAGVIAFRSLPKWWGRKALEPVPTTTRAIVTPLPPPLVLPEHEVVPLESEWVEKPIVKKDKRK